MTELLVTIGIAAMLMAIGVPSYRYVTFSNRATTEINSLLGDLQYARSEAVKEGWAVSVCPASTDYQSCATTTSWQNGWIIFSDVNNDHTIASTANILRVRQKFSSSTPDTLVSDNTMQFVTFNREGFATNFPATTTGYVTFTLHTTPTKADWTRCLQIFSTGLMNTERTTDPQLNCS
ncbi:MAG TPA: GspH/FimT family pseudopilin [Steroidobacteraceae bacterium]